MSLQIHPALGVRAKKTGQSQGRISCDRTFSRDDFADALREIRTGTKVIDLWSSQDDLVLKALAYVLGEHLDPVISASCHYVKCRGGAKSAVRKAMTGERVIAGSASPVIARNVMTKQSHA